jgi:aminoglycoside phosphotransferase family enzyme/predicted kinase
MTRAAAHGHAGPAAVTETHISVLTFLGDRVYKLKKPVRFDFLDFSTRERREHACQREVQLNRRLSPDVYLGVLDVVDRSGRRRDHLVEMVRMPPDRRLSTLVEGDDAALGDHIAGVARRLADFHTTARRGPFVDDDAGHDAVTAAWERELHELQDLAAVPGTVLDTDVLAEVAARARRWLRGRAPLFDERLAGGHAVDGHGDLQADDVFCLDDGPRILDCIEFSDRLRHVDVWDDIAFLLMDLERLGRPDVADRLAAAYREFSGDPAPASLIDVFIARRALVRAKVNALRAGQVLDGASRGYAAGQAGALLALAREHLASAEVRLVLVGGLPGTGKSTLAQSLGAEIGAVVLGSDATRKERLGLASTTPAAAPFGEGLYDPASTAATYRLLLERAEVALTRGESVVIDATWRSEARRVDARALADRVGARAVELRCVCPPELAVDRMRSRAARGPTDSDADAAVAARLAGEADPWTGADLIDTSRPPAACVDQALALVLTGDPEGPVRGSGGPTI